MLIKRVYFLFAIISVTIVFSLLKLNHQPQPANAAASNTTNPILFVTQFPIPADFTTIGSTFGNHLATLQSAGRGGDLWIRYPDGTLKNLTRAAGYGVDGFQNEQAIAVRQPAVHWSGNKAVFSMVVGAPAQQFTYEDYYWQLYEITGLGLNDTPVITLVPNQPSDYNNISPIYGTDDHIIFTSDRPRNGERHLYPQLDEYEEAPTNTGLWSLNPTTGDLFLLDHSPSGDFSPIIDSFGRVIFTRWDHLQRDQQADADADAGTNCFYCTFNYASEAADAVMLNDNTEVFPEPRSTRTDLLTGTPFEGLRFNHFFPWQVLEDGTELETLNHVGRHELHSYFNRSRNDDGNVIEFIQNGGHFNQNRIESMFHIREFPTQPGLFIGIDAPEFGTHSGGLVFTLNGAPSDHADQMSVTYLTHPDTADSSNSPSPDHSGLYRNPLPMSDGSLIVVHTAETRDDDNEGTRSNPRSRYDFRLRTLTQSGQYWVPDQFLTNGISETITYWDPDLQVTYTGYLWELDPVEVVARTRPDRLTIDLPTPEQQVFDSTGVDLAAFQAYLRQRNLAVVVSRDVTTRDDLDKQQPYNLRVTGSDTQSIGSGGGTIYDVSHMQFFQGDQIRGLTRGRETPIPGRRVLAQFMHDANAYNPPNPTGPTASVQIGADGSMAAIVPARRALSWQLTNDAGDPIVRERYWLTFQPGEVRVCASCHGLNDQDQAGQLKPQNQPEALRELLQYWQALQNLNEEMYLPVSVK